MVTKNQKPLADTQKIKGKESKHSTKESHHTQGKRAREGAENYKTSQKTFNKLQ